jgi:hypothetical protein
MRTFISFWLLATFLLAIASPGEAQETEKSQVDQTADAIYKELTGIDKNLHRHVRQTAGRKRATASLHEKQRIVLFSDWRQRTGLATSPRLPPQGCGVR